VKPQALKPPQFPWFDYSRYSFSLGLKVADRTYLSGHSASEHDPAKGIIVVRGGMAEQARTAWAKIETILAAGGDRLANVVRVVEYVTPRGIEEYSEAERERRAALGANRPAINTVLVNSLLRPQALIEIEVTARSGEPLRAHTGDASARGRAVDGLVYLSSLLPIDDAGKVIAPGDVIGQTRAIFNQAARVLGGFGLGLADVAKTVDYLTPAALANYKATAEVRREYFAPVFPAATGILMSRVAHPEAMIQVDFIASRGPRAAINPGWAGYANLTYSPGILTGDTLFVSGHAAINPETGRAVHEGDITAQAEFAYEKILRVLEAAGGGPEHLVKTIEYVTPEGLPRYREVAEVRKRMLRAPMPASTGVVCERLLRPELQIEIDSLAILG
jgi:enamine deaminase RidA (YjgF/YER057c/UK114 family)